MADKFNLGEVSYDDEGGNDAEDMPHWGSENSRIIAYHYPFCCTGLVLAKLGGSGNAYGSDRRFDCEELKDQLTAWIELFKDGRKRSCGKQFISVCTTCEQEVANEVLLELGFVKSKPVNNSKYGGKLLTWMLELHPEENV